MTTAIAEIPTTITKTTNNQHLWPFLKKNITERWKLKHSLLKKSLKIMVGEKTHTDEIVSVKEDVRKITITTNGFVVIAPHPINNSFSVNNLFTVCIKGKLVNTKKVYIN